MKTNKQICEAFWNGADEGHSGNIFIEGATLFSYGHHFPMAVKLTLEVVAWNEDRYSNTTSKHQSHAYPYGKTIIPCNTEAAQEWRYFREYDQPANRRFQEGKAYELTKAYLLDCEVNAIEKEKRARLDHKKEYWHGEAVRYQTALKTLNSL